MVSRRSGLASPAETHNIAELLNQVDQETGLLSLLDQPFVALLLDAITTQLIIVLDEEKQILFVNDHVVSLLGFERSDLVGRTLASILREPETILSENDYTDSHNSEGSVHSHQIDILHFKTGNGRWAPYRAELISDFSAASKHTSVLLGTPIEAELDWQKKYETAAQAADLGSWSYDVETAQFGWDKAFAKQLGFSNVHQSRSRFTSVEDFIHPDDYGVALKACEDAIEDRTNFSFNVRITDAGDKYRSFNVFGNCEYDDGGAPIGITSAVRDITQQLEDDLLRNQQESQFNLIAESTNDIIIRINLELEVTYISPSAEKVLGYRVEDIGTAEWSQFIPRDHVDEIYEQFESLLSGEKDEVTVTYPVQHRQGNWIWLEQSVHPVKSPHSGQVLEFVSIARDVSERKRFELELTNAREKAEFANQTKTRFLANMSHELRTPLNAVMGFSEVLKDELFGEIGEPRYREYAHLIHDSGQLLLQLISDILDMSKIEAGKYDLYLEKVDLSEIVSSSIKLVAAKAEEKSIHLISDVEITATGIEADERSVMQVLLNLLTNAIKFTPDGGEITVSVRRSGANSTIEVRDNGIGIEQELISKLTLPFEQATTDYALAKEGTGLGLALVKSIVDLHHGKLEIVSKMGVGTTVVVSLPCSQPEPQHFKTKKEAE